jgi:hypothetical protein
MPAAISSRPDEATAAVLVNKAGAQRPKHAHAAKLRELMRLVPSISQIPDIQRSSDARRSGPLAAPCRISGSP